MRALLTFDTLITPKFIKFLFYVGVIFCCLSGLVTFASVITAMIGGAEATGRSTILAALLGVFLGLISGTLVTIIGVILTRISSELTLVIFMIRDELAWQREHHRDHITPSGD
ncbi:DUF4282 domain-containing protein [Neokomagataea thailandica]|uniref:DUF4282 domain-containing protein n=1 Tax=Neokomagataea tanensis NBRC 106556 TaxID=1223519 RepID=A0ABQ0QGK9_9PROT|nr:MULTISPECIES: DUF4282 domain-containing protein [Neokomagataea]GBR44080.1 hypothetical protein AA106556_0305 [Neokomagataea tanensis NBRC 106556]